MKKNVLALGLILAIATLSVAPTFATEKEMTALENVTSQKKKNQIVGKIVSINATNMTIEVAERNKKNKKDKDTSNDNMKFITTGETKTVDISNSKFLKLKDANEKNVDDNNKKEKKNKLSYEDFAVGDYVRITFTDEKLSSAKSMRKIDNTKKKANSQKTNKKNNAENGQ